MLDWVERLFHVAPDGGGGALEALYAVLAAASVAVAALTFRRRERPGPRVRDPRS